MQFAVVGNPITHSLSPLLHNSAFKALKIQGFYGRYCLENPENFSILKSLDLKGANVTIPYKEVAYQACDEVFGIANEIQAVNTLVFKKDKILGYNTDAEGFFQCITHYPLKSALIIGAGGSAKALACILKQNQIITTIINRSPNRLVNFKEFECFCFDDFKPKKYDIIINTTPAGLTQNTLPLEESKLKALLLESQLAFDLVYGTITPFLALAKTLNIPAFDGKSMLINQAILAFEIFMNALQIAFDQNLLTQTMQKAI